VRTQIYWISEISPGRLGIAARPRGGEWLEDEVRGWRRAGVDTVVSLLTPEEIEELNLQEEETHCKKEGIDYHWLPFPDRGLPTSPASVHELAKALNTVLLQGKTVAVHCRQGIGRSSVIVAAVLISSGDDPALAVRRIEKARGRPVPDTEEQLAWIHSYSEAAQDPARPTAVPATPPPAART
jgi:protein-tyrosine phosphatase